MSQVPSSTFNVSQYSTTILPTISKVGHNWSDANTSSNISKNATNQTYNAFDAWKISEELKIFLYVLYSLIFIVGVSGNALVCYVLGIKKPRKNCGDIFVISLAISDLLASIVVPLVIINDLVGDSIRWYFGEIGCYVLPPMITITLTASSWSLVLICVDRYRIVAYPFSAKPGKLMITAGIVFVWTISIGTVMKYTLSHRLIHFVCGTFKFESEEEFTIYVGCWMIVFTVLPLIVMVIIYILTARKLDDSIKLCSSNRALWVRTRKNRKIVRMFLTVITIFFILTTPYGTFYFASNYLTQIRANIDNNLWYSWNYGLFVVSALNSCVNPIIYGKMHIEINYFIRRQSFRTSSNRSMRSNTSQDSYLLPAYSSQKSTQI